MRTFFYRGAVLFLLLLLLAGCTREDPLPFYRLEMGWPASEVWSEDGVRYLSDDGIAWTGLPTSKRWTFTGETGGAVGVCGPRSPEEGAGYDVYEIKGDGERRFLLLRPNHFVFGPYILYFCFREDVPLAPPSGDTVSSVVMTADDREEEFTDGDLTDALLELCARDDEDTALSSFPAEDMTRFTLTLRHRDYPFLTAEITGRFDEETGAVCLVCQDRELRALSPEWAERFLADIDPARLAEETPPPIRPLSAPSGRRRRTGAASAGLFTNFSHTAS